MDIGSIRDPSRSGTAPADTSRVKPAEAPVADKESSSVLAAAKQASESKGAEKPATRAELEKAMNNIQEFVQSVRRDINFSLDDGNGRVVVKVTDATSGDVIRQIPSEEALKLAENLSEVRSLLFQAEA
jgi:flagellar protein FlaG